MTVTGDDGVKRCSWVGRGKDFYEAYHDAEWGVPVHDDRKHFEMICLEGAQAGLSWETILKKRNNYLKLFKEFDPVKCAKLTDAELEKRLENPGIIRNRLKVFGVRKNALAFLKIQKEFGSFDAYVWTFVGGKPINGKRKTIKDVPATTPESDALSKDLKKREFTFVGSTIVYAFMQAAGLVNDHVRDCFRYRDVAAL
ncbi:MAG: DNA-3-methyladenine glycosylase I [Rhodospirillaceae bacterium]